jgi:hypothetical protein
MKVYIVTLEGYGDDQGYEVVFATLDKKKTDDIERLWKIVKDNWLSFYRKPEENPMNIALGELKKKYHIITWSGRELRVKDLELG